MSSFYNYSRPTYGRGGLDPIAADLAQQHTNTGVAELFPLNGGEVRGARQTPTVIAEAAGVAACEQVVALPDVIARAA